MQDPYEEHYNTGKSKVSGAMPCAQENSMMSVLPRSIYRFNPIPIKILK